MSLPLRLVSVDGLAVDWTGQTSDMGDGGVSFSTSHEIPPGSMIEYEITLSSYGSGTRIFCSGKVLRCIRNEGAPEDSHLIAARMARYVFGKSAGAKAAESVSR